MPESFSPNDLKLIQAIGTAGTLTGAARLLKVDHSTAFRRLSAIELRLGAKLFERARDGYTPTSAGEMVIATGARVFADLTDLERRLAGEDLRPSGLVRLTTTDTLVDMITPVLAALRTRHPDIVVELIVANTFFTLTKRDADIALRPAVAAPEQLIGRRLATVATAPYASSAYLERCGKKTLSEYDWLGFEDSLSHLRSARWMSANLPARADCLSGGFAACASLSSRGRVGRDGFALLSRRPNCSASPRDRAAAWHGRVPVVAHPSGPAPRHTDSYRARFHR
ncbi:DNA-binding transcriptional LysR family regulator [Nitrobacteraceae bacterium AZCC 1564]